MLILNSALQDLDGLSSAMSERQIVQAGIDIAQVATGSRIGYLHFLNDDQDTIELGVWSRDTRSYCTATYDRHYPIASAGIWADSARQRQPCLHNDYASVKDRRGLPEGHSPLVRHLGLPVFEGDKVRLLIGVGNKPSDYDADDIARLDGVARRIWSLIVERRRIEHLQDTEQRFQQLQEIALVAGLEYDPGIDRLHVDHMFARIFGLGPGAEAPARLDDLLQFIVPDARAAVRSAFVEHGGGRRALRVEARGPLGQPLAVELKLESRPREIGEGQLVVGIVQDLSLQAAVEDLRRHADTDALTGLPNRRRLRAMFEQDAQGRRGAHDGLALHYIDLDDFKPVNDQFGHAMGDEVLRMLAHRLTQIVRRDDLVVRLGGDEFVVVQTGIGSRQAAEVLADKIIAGVCEPITALGHTVRVGASIGIAYCAPAQRADLHLDAISAAADRALYQAKSEGGRRWRFAAETP